MTEKLKRNQKDSKAVPIKMPKSEWRFAELIWEREPIGSGELVRLCEESFGWKKSTTYTVLKKLCKKGIFQNKDAVVTSLVKKEVYQQWKGEEFIEENFEGSLPKFVAAFMEHKRLNRSQLEEIKKLIDQYEEE